MAKVYEDLKVLQVAEGLADGVWQAVSKWKAFERDTVGKQLVRAVDSVGANIAEAFGRYHYGEKLQFLYYSRGSLFESKYWLNRTEKRGLLSVQELEQLIEQVDSLIKLLNGFTAHIKRQRKNSKATNKNTIRDEVASYQTELQTKPLFDQNDRDFLTALNNQ